PVASLGAVRPQDGPAPRRATCPAVGRHRLARALLACSAQPRARRADLAEIAPTAPSRHVDAVVHDAAGVAPAAAEAVDQERQTDAAVGLRLARGYRA